MMGDTSKHERFTPAARAVLDKLVQDYEIVLAAKAQQIASSQLEVTTQDVVEAARLLSPRSFKVLVRS